MNNPNQHPHPHISPNGAGDQEDATTFINQQPLSEWDFFVPAKDSDGHSARFNRHTATPSDVANEAELLVHSFSEEVQS